MTSKKVLYTPNYDINQRVVSSLTNAFLLKFTELTRFNKFQLVFDKLELEKKIVLYLKLFFSRL